MSSTPISYSDLRRARTAVIKRSNAKNPGHGSMDTMTPMVKLGLEVVEFDIDGANLFAREITEKNLYRISVAKKEYAINLFTAAMLSGMAYGAAAEQRRLRRR
jgi:hypothetical protein